MKRLALLCGFLIGCGAPEIEKPDVEVKGSALDYANVWLNGGSGLSGGSTAAYSWTNGSVSWTALDHQPYGGQNMSELDTNLLDTRLANGGNGGISGIVINTTSGTSGAVNRPLTHVPQGITIDLVEGSTFYPLCSASNFTIQTYGPVTRTQQGCGAGKFQYQIQTTVVASAALSCFNYAQTSNINVTYTDYTACLPGGDWACIVACPAGPPDNCPNNTTVLGHYNPNTGVCTAVAPGCPVCA